MAEAICAALTSRCAQRTEVPRESSTGITIYATPTEGDRWRPHSARGSGTSRRDRGCRGARVRLRWQPRPGPWRSVGRMATAPEFLSPGDDPGAAARRLNDVLRSVGYAEDAITVWWNDVGHGELGGRTALQAWQ